MPAPFASPEVEDALIPLSALQHQLFCPRQCALIHVEGLWAEDGATAEGRILHERVDAGGRERRPGVRDRARAGAAFAARSASRGCADVVEFSRPAAAPFPVEYKRGKPKAHRADEVQLCAQAICLEEMFGGEVAEGALFYGTTRRRQPGRLRCRLARAHRRNRHRGTGKHRRRANTGAGAHAGLPALLPRRPVPARSAGKTAAYRPLASGAGRRLRRASGAPHAEHDLCHQRGRVAAQGRRQPRGRGRWRRTRPRAAAPAGRHCQLCPGGCIASTGGRLRRSGRDHIASRARMGAS